MTLPNPWPDAEGNGWPAAVGPIPWPEFRAEMLALYAPPLRAKATFARIRRIFDLVEGLGVASTADLTPTLVARLIASRPATESPHTTHSYVTNLRTLCSYAEARGYLRASPFRLRKNRIRKGPPRRIKRFHSREEIARVLARMKAEIGRKAGWAQWRARRLYALAATVAYTGLRRNEALYLRVEDIDFEARLLLIHPGRHRLKTEDSAQPVPIPDALVPVLAEWLPYLAIPEGLGPRADYCPFRLPAANPEGIRDPGWVFPNTTRTGPWIGGPPGYQPVHRMKTLGTKAGVEGFTFQSLRHSWATHAEYWGLSDAMIQRVLRHSNVRTQWHYRHADAENIVARVRGVGFGNDLADAEGRAGAAPPALPPAVALPPAPTRSGPAQSTPKLSDADAAELRMLRESGWTYKSLCARYGVAKSTIHACLNFVTHREVPPWDGTGTGA
jgi:integrase